MERRRPFGGKEAHRCKNGNGRVVHRMGHLDSGSKCSRFLKQKNGIQTFKLLGVFSVLMGLQIINPIYCHQESSDFVRQYNDGRVFKQYGWSERRTGQSCEVNIRGSDGNENYYNCGLRVGSRELEGRPTFASKINLRMETASQFIQRIDKYWGPHHVDKFA